MTAADWIDNARSLTQSSSIPLGVPVNTHMDMLLRDTRRDLRSALDALEKVLEKVQPHRRIVMPGGSVDEHDYVGELADDIEQLITEALGVES